MASPNAQPTGSALVIPSELAVTHPHAALARAAGTNHDLRMVWRGGGQPPFGPWASSRAGVDGVACLDCLVPGQAIEHAPDRVTSSVGPGLHPKGGVGLIVHVPAITAAGGNGLLLLRHVGDEGLRREDHRRDRGGVLKGDRKSV